MDSSKKLAMRERLHQVVVGSQFQPDDSVGFASLAAHDDRGNPTTILKAPQHLKSGEAGKDQVQDNQVGALAGQQTQHRFAVADSGDAKAILLQDVSDDRPKLSVVVDYHDMGSPTTCQLVSDPVPTCDVVAMIGGIAAGSFDSEPSLVSRAFPRHTGQRLRSARARGSGRNDAAWSERVELIVAIAHTDPATQPGVRFPSSDVDWELKLR